MSESTIIIRTSKPEDNQAIVDLFVDEKIYNPEEIYTKECQESMCLFAKDKIKEGGDMYNVYNYYNKYHDSSDEEKSKIEKEIENIHLRKFWVAEDTSNGKIVGIIASTSSTEDFCHDYLELIRMTVDKNYKQHGIGRRLVQVLEEYAIKNNMKGVFLSTLKQMLNANKFYTKLGYELFHSYVLDAEKDLDVVFYRKTF